MSNSNLPHGHVPDLEPPLEAAVWSVLREPLDADAIARVTARAEAAFDDTPATITPATAARSPHHFLSRSLLMKSLSTVAAVAVVVGITFLLQPSSNAFADAIKKLQAARSLSYVQHTYTEGNTKPIESKVRIAKDGRQRNELAGGVVSISDAASRPRLTLLTTSKVALVSEVDETAPKPPKNDQLAWLEILKAHGEKPDQRLGQKTINGRTLEGFIAKQDKFAYTVWIDPQSKELVQVEHEMFVKGSSITRVVLTDFQIDAPMDESLFSYEVPEGYQRQKQPTPPKAVGGEEGIIEALRGFTKLSKGKFPKSITEWGEWAVLFSSDSKDGKLSEESATIMGRLGATLPFLVQLPKDDYEYTGAGKSLTDKRCIVFWHKTADGKLRAIFNDLSASEVKKEELP